MTEVSTESTLGSTKSQAPIPKQNPHSRANDRWVFQIWMLDITWNLELGFGISEALGNVVI
jgi:hypothetical protein